MAPSASVYYNFVFSYLSKGAQRPASLDSHQLNWIADFIIIIIITAYFTF